MRADVTRGRGCGHGVRVRKRELVQKVGIGRAQVEGDGPRAVVSDDAARKVATGRRGTAPVRAQDRAVWVGVAEDEEVPLERATKVHRLDRTSVRVADAGPKAKCVRPAAVGRDGKREGEVRHELTAVRAADAPERHQAVIRRDRRRPGTDVERVDRVAEVRRFSDDSQRASAIPRGFLRRRSHRPWRQCAGRPPGRPPQSAVVRIEARRRSRSCTAKRRCC